MAREDFRPFRAFLDIAYDQIDGGGQEGATPNVPHDQMMKEYVVKEAGYAYVYISNDNPTQVDVYFDEVSITHTPTNIIQYNEYYPFGLQAGTSWTRENNKNDYLYNEGSELNAVSGWYETFFRSYDPTLGRFMQVDPLATVTHSMSAYQYAGNNPVVFNDPSGLLYRPRDNQAPHWDLSSLPIWTGSRDEWSDQSGGGGGAQFAWNPLGGEEISREEWLERGGDPNVHADHYYPGAWEIQFGAESGAEQQGGPGDLSWGWPSVDPNSFELLRVGDAFYTNAKFSEAMWVVKPTNVLRMKKSYIKLSFESINLMLKARQDDGSGKWKSKEEAREDLTWAFNIARFLLFEDLKAGRLESDSEAREKFMDYLNGQLVRADTYPYRGFIPKSNVTFKGFVALWPN